jgi:D-serine deaminase-like pyridoxal phosphate-dependent protein
MNVFDLDTPQLVIDLDRVDANIAEMAQQTRDAGVRLRPHTKTHKIPEIAQLQLDAGASGITCAKVGEAEVMLAAGIDDILIAYPLYGSEKLARLQKLRERARVLVSLDSYEVAEGLSALGRATKQPVEIYVEVDTGGHRMGRAPGAPTAELVARIAELKGLEIVGLLTHAGHAYNAVDLDDRSEVVDAEITDLVSTKELCAQLGVNINEISVGSTPSARMEARHRGVTEVRPGTYVFNDTAMINLGVATQETCAAQIIATVVGRPTDERFVIDAGTKCFTSDGVGRANWIQFAGRDDLTMQFTTEEHGVGTIDLAAGSRLDIGDKLLVIPSHICPVLNLFDVVATARGGEVTGELTVAGRGKVR